MTTLTDQTKADLKSISGILEQRLHELASDTDARSTSGSHGSSGTDWQALEGLRKVVAETLRVDAGVA